MDNRDVINSRPVAVRKIREHESRMAQARYMKALWWEDAYLWLRATAIGTLCGVVVIGTVWYILNRGPGSTPPTKPEPLSGPSTAPMTAHAEAPLTIRGGGGWSTFDSQRDDGSIVRTTYDREGNILSQERIR